VNVAQGRCRDRDLGRRQGHGHGQGQRVEDLQHHARTGDTRLEFFLTPTNATSTGDIDLYMTPGNSTSPNFEFVSNGATATEHVDANGLTTPSVGSSRVWFVVVYGYNVKSLRSGLSGETRASSSSPCSTCRCREEGRRRRVRARADGDAMGLWLPTLALLAGLIALRRRQARA